MIDQRRGAGHNLLRFGLPLAGFAILVCLRMPNIVIKGRFWAEEGQHFFLNAWEMAPLSALLAPYGGYLNLVANAAPLAARWLMPLPLAPYVTIMTGLAFQLCPPLLLLTARDRWLQPVHVRMAALLLLLLVPATEEVWLQTLHCQFELLLCGAIILTLDTVSGWRARLRLGLLALAPLTGVVVIALLPLFVLRAALDRSLPRLVQACALGAAAAVQVLFFFNAVDGRGYALHPGLLLCVFTIRHLALPLLGVARANVIATSIRASLHLSRWPILALILPILTFGFLLAASLWRRPARPAFWLVTSGGLIALASYFGAIGGVAAILNDEVYGNGRYVFVPQTLFYLTALALTATATGWSRLVGWMVVIWLLGLGARAYTHPFSVASDGPSWRDEVTLWRQDPAHAMQLWPTGWKVTLDPLHR